MRSLDEWRDARRTAVVRDANDEGKTTVHKFPDRADEQSKEAELVQLPTPRQTIWIDLMTGTICTPEPTEQGGQVIPFTAPRSGLREKSK